MMKDKALKSLRQTDQGASAILIASTMFLILGFAAIAVDFGAGVNERRLDQSTADTAALSAGVELIVSGDAQGAVDSAKQFVNDNLDRTVSNSDWSACSDSDALPFPSDSIPGISNGSNCISFGPNDSGIAFAKIRVRVPNQTSPAFFSRILGASGIVTSAAAEVQLDNEFASGAFPAAVFSNAGAGDQFCIKTGTSGQASCGSPSTGDFGNFQPYFYTELAPGNPSTLCTAGNQVQPLSRAMADGIDHFLGVSPNPTGTRRNGDNCPQFPGPLFPDRVDSGGGNSTTDLTNGLVAGGNYDGAFTGRLTRQIWGAPYGTATIFLQNIDNRPLWSYIDPAALTGPSVPAACGTAAAGPDQNDGSPAAEAAYLAAQSALTTCLSSPQVPDSLFVEALYDSPRLTIVPRYWESVPLGSNACCYNIKAFVPVFIDGIWTSNGPQWTCDGGVINDSANGFCKHEPGRVGTIHINAAGQRRLSSAGATVLSCDILPGVEAPAEKCKKVGTGPSATEIYLNIELTR